MKRSLATWLLALIALPVFAEIPLILNHQGLVRIDGKPFTGSGQFKFGLVDGDGKWVWTNDGSNLGLNADDANPVDSIVLPVNGGIYQVRLGDTLYTNMTAIPANVFQADEMAIRVIFDDGVNGELAMVPDREFSSVAYAFRSRDADMLSGSTVNDLNLVGEVRMWAGAIANLPSGWLFCDGSAVSRATYADLYAVCGDIYGAGDGSTTFNLPDFRDRSPMGARQDDASVPKTNVSGALTQNGGAAEHTLTVDEMPSHNHEMNFRSGSGADNSRIVFENSSNTSVKTTGSAGGDQPHNNLHPYFAISFIIKY